ncbi:MAG: hypothetical protein K2J51_01450, partial [Alistipes sp.]|nr:hypothetical protein [Alistipes sp.]
MKKLFLSLIILLSVSGMSEAQTYCYKYAYRVNKDTGVKKELHHNLSFYTFNSNKSFCYLSDENGMKGSINNGIGMNITRTDGWGEYRYIKTENGVHIYKGTVKRYSISYGGGYELYETEDEYLYFSSDYDKLNRWTDDAITHGNSGYGAGAAIGRS